MKYARNRWILLVLVAVIMTMVGCGGQAPANSGPKVIKVLTMQQAGPTPDEMNSIVARFNETYPDIKVEIDYVSYDALHDKITTAMSSSPPSYDVFLVDDIWYAEFAKDGYLWDVTSKIDENMKTNIFPAAWDVTTVDGKVYGMPWLLDQMYLYYNADILKKAGFDNPPKTWEEMENQAKVIKEKGLVDYPIVWEWGQIEASICDFVALLYGNGGTFVDAQGKAAFNNEKGQQVLSWMVKTLDEGISNPASISYGEEDCRNVFSQGKAAFTLNWEYMYDLANNNPKESSVNGKVKVALVPVFDAMAKKGIKSATINGSMGFSVAAKSPNRDAGWEFVKFLTSEPIQKEFSAHMLPIWSNDFEGDALISLEKQNAANPVMVPAFKAQFPYAHVRPKVPYYLEGSKILQLALQQALTKQKSPVDALNDAAAKWNSLK